MGKTQECIWMKVSTAKWFNMNRQARNLGRLRNSVKSAHLAQVKPKRNKNSDNPLTKTDINSCSTMLSHWFRDYHKNWICDLDLDSRKRIAVQWFSYQIREIRLEEKLLCHMKQVPTSKKWKVATPPPYFEVSLNQEMVLVIIGQ